MGEDEERKLCSLGVVPGQGQYQCRLNLGQEKYCGQVNINYHSSSFQFHVYHRGLHFG